MKRVEELESVEESFESVETIECYPGQASDVKRCTFDGEEVEDVQVLEVSGRNTATVSDQPDAVFESGFGRRYECEVGEGKMRITSSGRTDRQKGEIFEDQSGLVRCEVIG